MDKIKLHIGCGKRDFGKDWIHIDAVQMPHIQLHDVTKLPFKDHSVSVIYASHLIAYFDRQEIVPILKEWRRVLRVKGVLRIATPDWNVLRQLPDPMLGPLYGRMGDKPIYHKTVYTKQALKALLDEAGFYKFRLYDHYLTEHAMHDDHSAAYHKGKLISLNVECYA